MQAGSTPSHELNTHGEEVISRSASVAGRSGGLGTTPAQTRQAARGQGLRDFAAGGRAYPHGPPRREPRGSFRTARRRTARSRRRRRGKKRGDRKQPRSGHFFQPRRRPVVAASSPAHG